MEDMEEEEENEDEVTKASRLDRKLKMQQRKLHFETVIKCSLGSVLQGEPEVKKNMRKIIDNYVDAFSKRMVLGSINMNKLLRELFDGVPTSNIKDVQIPMFTTTMIRQLMLGLQSCYAIHPTIKQFYKNNPMLLAKVQDLPRYEFDRQIYCFGAIKFLTNFENYYWMNLDKWIKTFIYSESVQNAVAEIVKKENDNIKDRVAKTLEANLENIRKGIKKIKKPTKKDLMNVKMLDVKDVNRFLQYDIHSWTMDANLKKMRETITIHSPWLIEQLAFQHDILGNQKMTDKWLRKGKANKPKMIRYCVFINRFMKDENEKWRPVNKKTNEPLTPKKIPVAPMCTAKSHFITIDTCTLYSIMKNANLFKEKLTFADFSDMGMDHWQTFLNFKVVQGKCKSFTRTIDTDGISVCIHFWKPKSIRDRLIELGKKGDKKGSKPVEEKFDAEEMEGWNIVGCDPGRTFIYYMVREKEGGGGHEIFKLSRNQYYNDSGMFRARKQTETWLRDATIKRSHEELSAVSSKGDSLVDFDAYLEVFFKHWTTIWNEMTKKRWGNQRLRLYSGKKRTFARFFNRLEGSADLDQKTCVAYGSAKFAPGGKGETSVPTSRAFKECANRCKTFVTSEFRSTRIWNEDKKTLLQGVMSEKNGKKIRGLLWCNSTVKDKSKYINRDLNAAKNILDCFTLPERPIMLSRSKEALPKMEIGKIIKY